MGNFRILTVSHNLDSAQLIQSSVSGAFMVWEATAAQIPLNIWGGFPEPDVTCDHGMSR